MSRKEHTTGLQAEKPTRRKRKGRTHKRKDCAENKAEQDYRQKNTTHRKDKSKTKQRQIKQQEKRKGNMNILIARIVIIIRISIAIEVQVQSRRNRLFVSVRTRPREEPVHENNI